MNRFQTKLAIVSVSLLTLAAGRAAFAEEIRWATDLGAAQRQATQEGKLLLLHFQSKDCPPCRNVEATVFTDAKVVGAIHAHFVPVLVDVEELPELAAQFQVKNWPTDVIVDTTGAQLYRGNSPANPNVYRAQIETIAQLSDPTQGFANTSVAEYEQATAQPGQSASFETAGSVAGAANDPYAGASPYSDEGFSQPGYGQSAYESGAADSAVSTEMAAYAPPKEEIWAPSNAAPAHDPYATRPPEVSLAQSPRDPMMYGKPDGALGATPQFDAPAPSTAVYGSGDYAPAANMPAANPYQQVAYGSAGASAGPGSGVPASPAGFAHSISPASSEDLRLGLDGHCPVTLIVRENWAKGDPRLGARHRGIVYLFADAVSRDMFLADPDQFALAWQGIDPVELVDHGRAVFVKGELGCTPIESSKFHGIARFQSEANLEKFGANQESEDYYVQKMEELLRHGSNVAAGVANPQR
ncbi:MAG TPA: DUF255 domain-containing protein [Pirellulaceae bacterium]|jgi:thiol-disulfide isomerase/thioredoxin|nr:DUF255 domain-containing protein [Pirellulaceae bacterium]